MNMCRMRIEKNIDKCHGLFIIEQKGREKKVIFVILRNKKFIVPF